MTARVILFGATGYTGRLAAHSMVAAGLSPVLAGRSAERLAELADELAAAGPAGATVTWQTADVAEPATVHALVTDSSDVLVSTVGPFTALGDPAISAAIRAGAAYVDSTGEPPFIERVFTDYHRQALVRGAHLLTAFGYDYVPGNLAGALAIKQARENGTLPVRVEIGYFVKGAFAMSSGTRASSAGVMFAPSFAFHHGRVQPERAAKSTSSFYVDGRPLDGLSVGGSEHFALPHIDPNLRDVGVYLGWFGPMTKPMQIFSAGGAAVTKIPGVRAGLGALSAKLVKGSTGGPDAAARAGSRSVICAVASDADGRELSSVRLVGPNGYDLTADFLAWGSEQVAAGNASAAGALGPVQAFGLDVLAAAAASYGLVPE